MYYTAGKINVTRLVTNRIFVTVFLKPPLYRSNGVSAPALDLHNKQVVLRVNTLV